MSACPGFAWIIPRVRGLRGLRRIARAILSIVALLAFLLMAAGTAAAGFVGSDDTVFNRPTQLGEDGRPLLTAPDLLAYEGVTVTLRASAPDGVFIATAHPVDVADFVGDSARIRLTSVTRTGVVAEDVGSGDRVEPAEADFWTASMSGTGVEELTLDRDTSANQWVIAPVGGVGPTTVSFGITVDGLFTWALVAAATGALVLLLCVELLLRSRRKPRPPVAEHPTAADRIAAFVPDEAHRPAPAAGKRKAHRAFLAVALSLSLAGCTVEDLLPTKRQATDLATTKVALTKAELPSLLASYDQRLRTAIEAARPPRYRSTKWRLADRGPALESDLFGTRVGKLTSLGRRSVPTHDGCRGLLRPLRRLSHVVAGRVAGRSRDPGGPVHQGVRAGAVAAPSGQRRCPRAARSRATREGADRRPGNRRDRRLARLPPVGQSRRSARARRRVEGLA